MTYNRLFSIIFVEMRIVVIDNYPLSARLGYSDPVLQRNFQDEEAQVGEYSNTINITVTRQIEV